MGYPEEDLNTTPSQLHEQVKDALPTAAVDQLHDLQPGDWVAIKDPKRKTWKTPRWTGTHQVLLTTHTAVKVAGRLTWVHAHHCKQAPAPSEEPPCGSNNPDTPADTAKARHRLQ